MGRLCNMIDSHGLWVSIPAIILIIISSTINVMKSLELRDKDAQIAILAKEISTLNSTVASLKIDNDNLLTKYQIDHDRWIEDKQRFLEETNDRALKRKQ